MRKALASGPVPVASHLPLYEELIGDGERGLLFPPGDAVTLAGQLERLIAEPGLRGELRSQGAQGAVRDWDAVADQLEDIYRRVCARRHDPARQPRRARAGSRVGARSTSTSTCTPTTRRIAPPRSRCCWPPRATAGSGAIAITDHNEISGALAAREVAEEMGGIKVIVAEEVKTAEQGEVIGLFLEEKIPRGMTMAETIAEIRRQGGLVYVPHPFDRLHSVPDYEHLLRDGRGDRHPRGLQPAGRARPPSTRRPSASPPSTGSSPAPARTATSPRGSGSVMIRVHDFDGPEEFLEAMRDADIVRKHKNLIYVQALKLLQTTGRRTRRAARQAAGQGRPAAAARRGQAGGGRPRQA